MCGLRWLLHWPAQVAAAARGGIRAQFHNVIDVAPTVFEACGVSLAAEVDGEAQMPLHGTSMLYALDAPAAASSHRTQYFEMFGHRAIFHDG